MRNRVAVVSLAAGLALGGCSSLSAGGSRAAYVRDVMRDYRFPVACEQLWVEAMRVLAQDGFQFVGADREAVGQEKQGVITNFLNAGHSTTRDDDGVLETETDFTSYRLRYQIRATPAGKDGCYVQYTSIKDDRVNETQARHREYDKELQLLTVVAPAEGARIAGDADKAK